jgi:hypothetical protein
MRSLKYEYLAGNVFCRVSAQFCSLAANPTLPLNLIQPSCLVVRQAQSTRTSFFLTCPHDIIFAHPSYVLLNGLQPPEPRCSPLLIITLFLSSLQLSPSSSYTTISPNHSYPHRLTIVAAAVTAHFATFRIPPTVDICISTLVTAAAVIQITSRHHGTQYCRPWG